MSASFVCAVRLMRGHIALRGDRQQITHFPQAKSQRLRAPDEVQSRELKLAVPAVARRRPIEREKGPMCPGLGGGECNPWAGPPLFTPGCRPPRGRALS